ncbi:hypothetical protein QBC44DRAFT_304652 [Cladorrhinum sp. PSN332]|nr:hypothetical protein QBC44DRAFT_304652 [Cladorrhinum sp. PSN332]
MKRSKSYRPGMTGSSGGLSMQQLGDTLQVHLDEPTSYLDYEEPIMEDLESESESYMSYSASSEERVFSFNFSPSHCHSHSANMPTPQTASSRTTYSSLDEDLMFDLELHSQSQSQSQSPTPLSVVDDVNCISPSSQSRAIAIPSTRRPDHNSVPALSARGDLQGAYFPNHEDPSLRVTPTHPFYPYAAMARRNSLKQAAASARASIPSTAEIGPDGKPKIPTGKYYPANWEKAHNQPPLPIPPELQPLVQRSANPSISIYHNPASPKKTSKSLSPSAKTQAPPRNSYRHNRTESEAQRLVHTYQKDMVIQACNGIVSAAEGSSAYNHNQHRGSLSPASRPLSPRLEPLGSPIGPVTPMSLEDDNGGYLTLGQPMIPEAADLQSAEVNRAIRADRADRARRREQRHKRNNSSNSHQYQHHWSALSTGLGQMSF